jgi:hypothetical protein
MRRLAYVLPAAIACACGGGSSDPPIDPDAAAPPADCIAPGEPFEWPAPTAPIVIDADPAWKNEIDLPWDPFLSPRAGNGDDEVVWVKFIVLLRDPTKVYFQDSAAYPFHYDFAVDKLAPFAGMDRATFDSVTLHREGQEAVLGAVLVPQSWFSTTTEYGVQLVIEDEVHPELVRAIFELVVDHVNADGLRPLYLPNPRQAMCLDEHASFFAGAGIEVGGVDRWIRGDGCYANGWAIGEIVRLSAAEVDAAWLDGRLDHRDILLLDDAAPAEVPPVAGILTLAPSTPSSHAAILARSYGVPFVHVRRPEAVAEVSTLVGRHVVVQTGMSWEGGCRVRFVDVNELDETTRAEIRALGQPPPLDVTPARSDGRVSISTDDLAPDDIDLVGGKAAHFGLLRDAIPESSPDPAIALTFDVWRRFLDQPAPGGAQGTLGDEIARRLAPHVWPPNLLALDATLDGIRDLVRAAPFPEELASDVHDALQAAPFDPERRLRFRSSTNVEDSATFTGAGLYDSATGCLADDLDADAVGPSRCNPAQPEERGVHRAIQDVFASFYRRNAVFERMRRGVDEADVGMAILVHVSVPDATELANGVAVLQQSAGDEWNLTMVSQLGAVSVTNPDGTALPEVVHTSHYSFGDSRWLEQPSSLVALGDHVMTWEDDYRAFEQLFAAVAGRYAQVVRPPPFTLDLEYKKIEPGVLSVKQVRPLPLPDTTEDVIPFLVGEPRSLCVFQGEASDIWAVHRLKSRLALDPASLWLDAAGLAGSFYDEALVDFTAAGQIASMDGDPSSFVGAQHDVVAGEVRDSWTTSGDASGRWTVSTTIDLLRRRNECPVLTLDDATHGLAVAWDEPVPFIDWSGPSTRTDEYVLLAPWCPGEVELDPGSIRVDMTYQAAGVEVVTAYWWPPAPTGPTAGYTAPLVRWEQTTITGLASQPIVLGSYWSQSYRPAHHNFGAEYIFEPRLEPGLSPAILAELAAADIVYLYVLDQYGGDPSFLVAGADGTLRPL